MQTSELHAKLIDFMMSKRNAEVLDGLNPISTGVDIKYEAGRRIGARQGMDLMIERAINFFKEQEKRDENL